MLLPRKKGYLVYGLGPLSQMMLCHTRERCQCRVILPACSSYAMRCASCRKPPTVAVGRAERDAYAFRDRVIGPFGLRPEALASPLANT